MVSGALTVALAGKISQIVGCTLAYLAVFDIAGVVVSLVFDISPSPSVSGAAYYALWLVLGVFCGLFNYGTAYGDDPQKTGRVVCATVTILLSALSVLFFVILWNGGSIDDSYVPDNMPLTLTFFVAVTAGTFLGHNAFQPAAKTTK